MSFTSDGSAAGFIGVRPDALRYGETSVEPNESVDPTEAVGILRSFIPAGARVLDVGCGAGGVTRAMTNGRTDQVVCVEPDQARAAAARDRGLEVHCGVFNAAFVSSHGPFDAIVFGDVLEHMADPAEALALALDRLTPSGAVLISVPNVAHWTIRLKLLFGRFDYAETGLMDATHLRWFTRKTLIGMLERQGFAITDMTVSAGRWLHAYRRLPWRLLSTPVRNRFINALVRSFPTLFGCQHVVRAVVRRRTISE